MAITVTADDTIDVTTYSEFKVNDVITYVQTNLGGTVTTATALKHVLAAQMTVLKGLDTRWSPPRNHIWSFTQTEVSYTFSATVTGTATGQGTYSKTTEHTTLTASSATFDDSMIGHNLTFTTSEEVYEIVAFTSTTVIVLEGDASAEKSGDTFSIDAKGYHATPTGFRGIKIPPVFAYSASGNRYSLVKTSPAAIRAMWRNSNQPGYTRYWALEPITFSASTGQTYRFLVAPMPTEDMVASMRVFIRVPDPAAGMYFPGGDLVSMAIRDEALASVELVTGATKGVWAAAAQASLWSAIDADNDTIASVIVPAALKER